MKDEIIEEGPRSIYSEGKEEVIRRFWRAKPFPHIWIDNFLPEKQFCSLMESGLYDKEKAELHLQNSATRNKTTYSARSVSEECRRIVSSLTSPSFLQELSVLTSLREIIPLTAYEEQELSNQGFYFYHRMEDGGFLGPHVDHSKLRGGGGHIHFLNSIFYCPKVWDSSWGGHTMLFDKWGWKEKARVECVPNRLLIFLHTSQSFHGVSRLVGNSCDRLTVYMDYYSRLDDLHLLNRQSGRYGSGFECKFWRHPNVFVPRTWKDCRRYLLPYLLYLLRSKHK